MKKRIAPLTIVALLASTSAWAATGAVSVKIAKNTTLGSIVVNAKGMTLYHMTSEKGGKIACTGGCAMTWPPLLVSGKAKPVGGAGIATAKLGTVTRPDGKVQVTYAGSPLYLYSGDSAAGDANGEAVGGLWFALGKSGAIVKPSATAASASSSSSSTSSSSDSTSQTPGYNNGY